MPTDFLSLSLSHCVSVGLHHSWDLFHSRAVGINGDDLIEGAHTLNNEFYSFVYFIALEQSKKDPRSCFSNSLTLLNDSYGSNKLCNPVGKILLQMQILENSSECFLSVLRSSFTSY